MFYKNARIFTSDFQFHMGAFEVKDGLFGEVLSENVPADAIDLNGATVIPGLVEVHSHGNSGADFSSGKNTRASSAMNDNTILFRSISPYPIGAIPPSNSSSKYS